MDPIFWLLLANTAGGAALIGRWLAENKWAAPHIVATAKWVRRRVPGYETRQMLERLVAEMRPNGGGSLRDAIDRIERRARCHEEQLSLIRLKVRVSGIFDDRPAFTADRDGKCTWVSPAYEKMVEMSAMSVIGDGWVSGIHQDDRERVFYAWNFAVQHHTDFHMTYRYCGTRTGKCIKMHVDAYAARDDHDDTCAGWVGIMRRIDD